MRAHSQVAGCTGRIRRMNIELLPTLIENHVETPGIHADRWIEELPRLVVHCCSRWSLSPPGTPFPDAQYNYVAPSARNGKPVVLKIVASKRDFDRECRALTCYKGDGSVGVISFDESIRALLLERIQPGNPLADIRSDDEATRIAARLMTRLWRRVTRPDDFDSVAEWAFRRADLPIAAINSRIPIAMMDRAVGLFRELTRMPSDEVLAHGDLDDDR